MKFACAIVFILILASCSPKEDPCVRAVDTASVLITEHEKFEISVADAAQAWRLKRPKDAAAAKARAADLAPGLADLSAEFTRQADACRKR